MKIDVFKSHPDILFVDDYPEFAMTFIDILISKGANVRVCKSGEEALIEIDIKKPDLILLDVILPKLNGYEICSIIRSNIKHSNIPIIFVTAENNIKNIVQGFKSGGQDYIIKPFNEIEFIHRIETQLKLKKLFEINIVPEMTNRAKVFFDEIFSKLGVSIYDILEKTEEGIVVTDVDGYIIYMNMFASILVECDREFAIGKHFMEIFKLFNFDTKEKIPNPILEAINSNNVTGLLKDTVLITNKNKTMFLSASISPFKNEDEQIKGVVCAIRDVTKFRIAEEKIIEAKNIAEETNKLKSMFIANTSHELRTPLNGIFGISEILLHKSYLTKDDKENVEIIINCAETLLKIVNDILDFSKIEAGKIEIYSRELDLGELLEKTINMNKKKAFEKGIDLLLFIDKKIDTKIFSDGTRVQQILNNLISNAIKFTHIGVVTLKVSEFYKNKDRYIKFIVSDTGIGINQNDISKLFKEFSQVDGSYTRQFSGTGLGLSISKRLAKLLGGDIWVESTPLVGSEFTFTIKSLYSNNIEYKANTKLDTKLVDEQLKGIKILLAEDIDINQNIFEKIAKMNSMQIDLAKNGLEAVYLSKKNLYDIVFMDIQMPVMDGVDAFKEIRNNLDSLNRDTPIIALTAHAIYGDKNKFISIGMNDYISKPFRINDITAMISKHCIKQNKTINIVKEDSTFLLTKIVEISKKLLICIDKREVQEIEKYAAIIKENLNLLKLQDGKFIILNMLLELRQGNFKSVEDIFDEFIKYINSIDLEEF